MAAHEEKFTQINKKIRANTDQLDAHSKLHEQAALFRESTIRNQEQIEKNIRQNKRHSGEELNKAKDEIYNRIDELDKQVCEDKDELEIKLKMIDKQIKTEIEKLAQSS